MDHVLDLGRKVALEKLSDLSYMLFEDHDIKSKMDIDSSISYASTYMNENGFATDVSIGVREIYYAKRTLLHFTDPVISDEYFAKTVLNMYHEYAHCIQKNQIFRQADLTRREHASFGRVFRDS